MVLFFLGYLPAAYTYKYQEFLTDEEAEKRTSATKSKWDKQHKMLDQGSITILWYKHNYIILYFGNIFWEWSMSLYDLIHFSHCLCNLFLIFIMFFYYNLFIPVPVIQFSSGNFVHTISILVIIIFNEWKQLEFSPLKISLWLAWTHFLCEKWKRTRANAG